jgi:hypothetical protein
MNRQYAGIAQALQRSGVSARTVIILTGLAIALGLCIRALWGVFRLFLKLVVGVKL